MATGTVVIDAGHGGTANVGGSDANHAISSSGILEKTMTLDLAILVRNALRAANRNGHQISVFMTRADDSNLGLAARANVARDNGADLLVSIHFNGFDGLARGVETFVRPVTAGNVNHDDDIAFAQKVQRRVFDAVKARDPNTRNRGVKELRLGVLDDVALGNSAAHHPCRACLLEVEFIDVPAVDALLNTGAAAMAVRRDIANALAQAIIEELT